MRSFLKFIHRSLTPYNWGVSLQLYSFPAKLALSLTKIRVQKIICLCKLRKQEGNAHLVGFLRRGKTVVACWACYVLLYMLFMIKKLGVMMHHMARLVEVFQGLTLSISR